MSWDGQVRTSLGTVVKFQLFIAFLLLGNQEAMVASVRPVFFSSLLVWAGEARPKLQDQAGVKIFIKTGTELHETSPLHS